VPHGVERAHASSEEQDCAKQQTEGQLERVGPGFQDFGHRGEK
jgi:hypothetical protein